MRRFFRVVLIPGAMMPTGGSRAGKDVNYVLMDGVPPINSENVFFNGKKIGTITQQEMRGGNEKGESPVGTIGRQLIRIEAHATG